MSGSGKAKILWGSGSIPCWKAMIVLEEKGIEYESVLLSFSKKEHKGEQVTKYNPRGQMPTFIDKDGTNVNESTAVCLYLEQRYPNNPLIPTNEYAKVIQRTFEASENLQNRLMLGIVFKFFSTKKEDRDEKWDDELKKNKENFLEELKTWEGYLGQSKFAAGDRFTMADVFFFPFLAWAQRLGLNLDKYPKLKDYYNTVYKRPSIQKTEPPHWKEGPSDMDPLKDL